MLFGLPDSAIQKLRSVFELDARITNVWLYGSRVLGKEKMSSDIDLCVEGTSLQLSDLHAIENKIDELNLPWKVYFSVKNQIDNPTLLKRIQNFGISFLTNKSNC
jgi:predicted nucleotidyltransferase